MESTSFGPKIPDGKEIRTNSGRPIAGPQLSPDMTVTVSTAPTRDRIMICSQARLGSIRNAMEAASAGAETEDRLIHLSRGRGYDVHRGRVLRHQVRSAGTATAYNTSTTTVRFSCASGTERTRDCSEVDLGMRPPIALP